MKKTLYNLGPLQDLLQAANRRYLEFLSALDTPTGGEPQLRRLTESQTDNGHHYKGFNFFATDDAQLLRLLLRGEFAISGLTTRALHTLMSDQTTGQIVWSNACGCMACSRKLGIVTNTISRT